MNNDEIIESIRSICAPLPESRALRDKVIAAVEERFDALEAIRAVPSERTLVTHAEARAMYEIAVRALEAEHSQERPT